MITNTWELKVGPMVIGGEVHEVWQLLQSYTRCFDFNLKDLGQLKGQEV
jgi:hypothetical protein